MQASDDGMPSLSSTQTLTVLVLDVNDEAPVFERRVYNARVTENREPGQPVVRLSAVDLDSGEHTCICFQWQQPDGSFHPCQSVMTFFVSESGFFSFALTRNSNPYQLAIRYLLSLEIDKYKGFKGAFNYIHIHIQKHSAYASHVNQSCSVKCCPPTEENAIVSYSLLPGPGYEFFTIDSHSGLVSTSTQLDREIHQSFVLRGNLHMDIRAFSSPLSLYNFPGHNTNNVHKI